MRAASSNPRSVGDSRRTEGWHRLDGGIGGVDGPSEREGDWSLWLAIRASPLARRALAASAAPMLVFIVQAEVPPDLSRQLDTLRCALATE
mmetsp:Transcript_65661/g.130066  ORF Transcript_65661/g.130066 Transcript_65661/m.130066 type:complete len:91 (+) Transcript_65661:237-509(+)